ncbi:MAG: hypothetical protein HY319_10220, partial [Armatimonadetes bacterium]|nr:hypothetical protein [Armatimonadota bacterium]
MLRGSPSSVLGLVYRAGGELVAVHEDGDVELYRDLAAEPLATFGGGLLAWIGGLPEPERRSAYFGTAAGSIELKATDRTWAFWSAVARLLRLHAQVPAHLR